MALAHRFGFAGRDTGRPIPMVVEADLGCGTGRNAIYLVASRLGCDRRRLVRHAIALARRKADAAGVSPRLLEGDVTRLEELGVGGGFDLLVDSGCYHAVPMDRGDAYAAGVTAVAAPGARLLMFGVGRAPVQGAGVDP